MSEGRSSETTVSLDRLICSIIDAALQRTSPSYSGEAISGSHIESEDGVVADTIGGLDIVVFGTDDGIHTFERSGLDFERGMARSRPTGRPGNP